MLTASVANTPHLLRTETTTLQTAAVLRSAVDIVVRTPTIYFDSDAISIFVTSSPPDFGTASTVTASIRIDDVHILIIHRGFGVMRGET